MEIKKVRKLKVYGFVGRNYKEPPKIILQGKWLEQCGFDCGNGISVECNHNKLVITKEERS